MYSGWRIKPKLKITKPKENSKAKIPIVNLSEVGGFDKNGIYNTF